MFDYPFDHAWWTGCILLGARLHEQNDCPL